jgi:phage gpG-like protein
VSVTIIGEAELNAALDSFAFNLDEAIDDAVRVTAIKVQQSAIKSIREPSMGTYVTRYTASGKPYSHVASKEGETPNTDTGRLIGSIALDHHKGEKVAYVGTNVDYGFFLETVMNRPWLQPAKDREIGFMKVRIKSAINKQIKQAGQSARVVVGNIKIGGK